MNRLPLFKLSVTLLLLLICSTAFAQSNTVWTKRVTRTINIQIPKDTLKHHIKDKTSDTTLLDMLVKEVYDGRITAYSGTDYTLSTKLSTRPTENGLNVVSDMDALFGLHGEIVVEDPLTGAQVRKMARTLHDYDFNAITSYRIMEDWSFDRSSGKTVIQIQAIAPIETIYNTDKSIRAQKSMFWIKYAEAAPILSRYAAMRDRQHLSQYALQRLIWDDYFSKDKKKNNMLLTDNIMKQRVTRMVNIQVPDDTVTHLLRDETTETSLLEMVVKSMYDGKIGAYQGTDNSLSTKLSQQEIKSIIEGPTDTVMVEDPVTRQQLMRVTRRSFNYEIVQRYRIMEDWSFDAGLGKTEIQIAAVAPFVEVYKEDGSFQSFKALFWLPYHDLHDALAQHEKEMEQLGHSERILPRYIWDDYFIYDTKPNILLQK